MDIRFITTEDKPFYNDHHPDPNEPEEYGNDKDEQFPDGMFRFEKMMK